MAGRTVTRHPDDWLELAQIAFKIADAAQIEVSSAFAFGGGTMLMSRMHHRLSRDLDIFLADAQYLTFLSPRLNPAAEHYENYEESSHHVRIAVGDREIDFIVAPHLTSAPTRTQEILGRPVAVETTAEILAKKLFYRGRTLKPRDVFDLAATIRLQPDALPTVQVIRDLLNGKLRLGINRRLAELHNEWATRATTIDVLPAGTPILPHAIEIARDWMAGI